MESTAVLQVSESPVDFAASLQNIQAKKQAILRKQQQDQDDVVRYMTQQLDYSKFATGTAADPVINDGITGIYRKYADRIKQNKGENLSGIMFDMQQDINNLKGYSINVKSLRENIDSNVNKYAQGTKDIDANVLKREALSSALFKIGENGQPMLKDPSEIDPNGDYVSEIIKNRPEVVFGKSMFWVNDRIKSMDEAVDKGEVVRDKNGVQRVSLWEAKTKPFEEIIYDKKTGQPTGVGIKTKMEKINGKDIPTLSPEVYDAMFGGTEDEFRIRAVMRRHAKENGMYVDPNTPEGEAMKRAVAYDLLKAFRPKGDFQFKDKENEDTWKSKQNAGITIINQGQGANGGGTDYVQAYAAIDEITKRHAAERRRYTQANLLPNKAQDAVLTVVRGKLGTQNIGIQDIKLVRDGSGNIVVVAAKNIYDGTAKDAPLILAAEKPITSLDKVGTDLSVNKTAKEKKEILKDNQPKKLTIKRSDISAKAAAAGYSAKDYEKLLRDKGVEIVN